MTENTQLGKIEQIYLGYGGYQDVQLGITVTLSGNGFGVCDFKGFWSLGMACNESSTWNQTDRNEKDAQTMRWVDKLMKTAGVARLEDLKGIPIEAVFEGSVLKSWRILEEVL